MSVKAHTTTKHAPKQVKPGPDLGSVIREMRSDIFMVAYRMQFTVADALVASRSGLHERTVGHLEEMNRILQNTMDKYR